MYYAQKPATEELKARKTLWSICYIFCKQPLLLSAFCSTHCGDRNSASESAKSISSYISLVSAYRKILTMRKDPSCWIHLRESRVRGQEVVRHPREAPKPSHGQWETRMESRLTASLGHLDFNSMPSCPGFGAHWGFSGVTRTPFPF